MTTPEREKFEKVYADKSGWPGSNTIKDIAWYFWQAALSTNQVDVLNQRIQELAIDSLNQECAIQDLRREVAALKTEISGYDSVNRVAALSAAPTPPEVEPVAWTRNGSGVITDKAKKRMIEEGKYGGEFAIAANTADRHNIPLYAHPPSPGAVEIARRDELLFENAELRGQLLKYEDPHKYMALCSVLSGTITKEQCEEWLKMRDNPKAEYDSAGNPLNLMAAAKDALQYMLLDVDIPLKGNKITSNLRK